ncbi:MAG: hypothetical protein FWE40_01860 [Oscillospiraceae bacterium]|nr:hypothetical protein [Oscillospiraceae bacterium]
MSYPNFNISRNCCGSCVCSTGPTGPQGPPGANGEGVVITLDHVVVGSGNGIMDSGVPLTQIEDAITGEAVARQMQVNALNTRIDGIGNLGFYVGAFDNFAVAQVPGNTTVPHNVAQFTGSVSLNDFITVRHDEIQGGVSTRYIIMNIDGSGNITWGYDITYSTDITGKMDKITPPVPGNLIMQDNVGNATNANVSVQWLLAMLDELNIDIMQLRATVAALLSGGVESCPQTGRLGMRFSVVGLTGGASMTETWSNSVNGVFGAAGTLGVHTNCTFWNAQLLNGNIAASAIAIRRSGGGTGANLDVYPRYTSGALGNNRANTVISFFMASNQTHAELGG